ncbi:MAG: tetratricopeptide repeat protein [Muribaculaceae bacterium]
MKKHLKGYFDSEDVRDGIGILYADGKNRYINMAKFKQIGKIYDSAEPFSEGLARVDENKFINKKGKVVADFKEFASVGKEFSENVIAVKYEDKHYHEKYGYVFSPLITWDCAYGQKYATKAVLNEWCNQADKYFKYEWYSTAEYVYRKVLNVEPDNQAVWVNYGVCLYHRGEKQQSLDAFSKAIELDPDDENAVNNYNIVKKQLEQKQQYAEEQNTQSGSGDGVYNALMNFANALTNAFGGQKSYSSGGYNGGYSSSYNSSSSYDTNSGGTNTSGASESTYRSMYSRWENEAKSLYESLTSRGSSSTSKSGEKSGTSNGYWKNKTSGLKSNLRNAQKQMRHIRSEALSKGIRIEQSKWETATVN